MVLREIIFRRNAVAFRAIGMGFGNVRSFDRSFDTKSAPRISRKPFHLESPNFMATATPTLSTATPDLTSLSTSSRQQIVQTCKFWAIFGSRFSITLQRILKKVNSFGNCDSKGSVSLVQHIRHVCSLSPKMGLKWAYRRLRVTQMGDFDFLGNL